MDQAPLQADDVTLGDPSSPVALCTLWTRQERILRGVPRELYAVCGNLYSLWGINLLVRGVLARPGLRYLVVCGIDYAETGRALVALAEQGTTPERLIVGTEVRLEPDLDEAAIARFRQQVTLVDLRGCTRADQVAAAIRALPTLSPDETGVIRLAPAGPTGAGEAATKQARSSVPPAESGHAEDPTAPSGSGRLPKAARFEADPRGNFLIAIGGGEIVAVHATTTGGPTEARFAGRDAAAVYRAILAADLVSRLDHAAYLGAELARAEIALRAGLPYRQDRPLRLPLATERA
jgi:tetrahydromethanopterin S-methyltransferase subunit A